MYDDDFIDRLLNSSGDDLDRLIENHQANNKSSHNQKDFAVDMSDIEKILNDSLESPPPEKVFKVVEVNSTDEDSTYYLDDYFKNIYEQLSHETYCMDKLSALQKRSQRENHARILTWLINGSLAILGIGLCLGCAIWVSQILLKFFPM
jgi:hypothetical protein